MSEFIQVTTASDSEEEARKIARTLVEERLAACAQVVGPVASTYWWRGKVEEAREWKCVCKTRRDLYEQVEEAILGMHSYELPQILALPVLTGLPAYLEWLDREAREA